jgi:DNA polymerase III subunit epsilon
MAFFSFRSPPWNEVEYWALDLETSGLKSRKHQILSVGMVPIRGGAIRWGENFYSLVRPEVWQDLAGASIGVHQILPEELRGAPTLEDAVAEIAARLAPGAALLVHHAPLDVRFLRKAFRHTGRRWPRPALVDTRVLVSRLEQRQQRLDPYATPLPRGLADLRDAFELPPFDSHHALADALATAELFLALRARLGAKTLREVRC